MGWWVVPCVVLGIIVSMLLFVAWQLFGYRTKVHPALPLQRLNGIPLLIQNELPYPGYFSSTSHPVIPLSGDWLFSIGNVLSDPTVALREVQVPVCFNTFGSEYAEYEGAFSYVKKFHLPAVENGLYRLCFKSVGGNCSVYLNSRKMCENNDSYQPFYCDITNAITAGENTLVVVGNNTPTATTLPPRQFAGARPGWHLYAGITKDVQVEVLPPNYCVSLHVSADDRRLSGSVVFSGNPQSCIICLLDDGKPLAEKRVILKTNGDYSTAEFAFDHLPGIEQWCPAHPKQYTLEARTEAETVAVTAGFRSMEAGEETFLLNGSPLPLRGICLHEEDISLGSSLDKSSIERNLGLVRELGCNFVRLAHYPHADETLDFCDKQGLCCWCEIPNYQAGLGFVQQLFGKSKQLKKRVTLAAIWQSILGTKQLVNEEYLTNAGIQLAKMVIRNQNRPSVAFWGVGNECFTYTPASRDALRFLRETVHTFDQTRLTGYAAFTIPAITQRFEKSFQVFDLVCANEYFGWYYGQIEDCQAFWESLQKKYHKPMLCTETGSDSARDAQGVDLPGRQANSEDYQVRMLLRHLRLQHDVPAFYGACIWVLKDFYCDEYGAEDLVPYMNPKGLVTSSYQKKKAFDTVADFYKAARMQ
ncbi:MAG: glycoside hydrolase family 2 TIM barrel-domain containing protein [Clostridiaceae bacterium]